MKRSLNPPLALVMAILFVLHFVGCQSHSSPTYVAKSKLFDAAPEDLLRQMEGLSKADLIQRFGPPDWSFADGLIICYQGLAEGEVEWEEDAFLTAVSILPFIFMPYGAPEDFYVYSRPLIKLRLLISFDDALTVDQYNLVGDAHVGNEMTRVKDVILFCRENVQFRRLLKKEFMEAFIGHPPMWTSLDDTLCFYGNLPEGYRSAIRGIFVRYDSEGMAISYELSKFGTILEGKDLLDNLDDLIQRYAP